MNRKSILLAVVLLAGLTFGSGVSAGAFEHGRYAYGYGHRYGYGYPHYSYDNHRYGYSNRENHRGWFVHRDWDRNRGWNGDRGSWDGSRHWR